ncbi:ABC transporter ATP-binding protein [Bifidobacterium crudilactis]|jgi:NitT/TauT family transport system ATP-binding protein|uniref:ATP-binding cassette domain-containing protein n=1 Tax=Bifidobacterium crudilactis TaxID=327277 RepID=A0A971CXX3_9BIFI|nr:nitrate/sulfonate/bicarbonate ABC transporter ATP-binding protein [Bifidobacterium crudilactis]MCI1869194.1 nitrate/sulfonate/bicarbonate ABC transporter ATP-binding protein [Bifidobacterium crudilactis]MDN5971822.1 nitrate/sulfonate/bicarbonate ABC transporter ATP-binding protein [Bifidobacterium crudilactis]MDN6001824.1 nitrate/sulfonate/bicarbonate ABC transporter ATP-binding protein [Bifidobacterium crudilactis]MDN6209578.1 nitrate/sulfonate/bicarbonate ABC transporter ATP-binding protei
MKNTVNENTVNENTVEKSTTVGNAALPVITATHVSKNFLTDNGEDLTVLKDLSLTLHEGEIVAILGRSGAGKSTFLRILAGLVPPSEGKVEYRGTPLSGPNPGVAMVFQTFALMPWLTVESNVELGLQARGVGRKARKEAALQAIDSIGLDGFESAYPKELSGGMRQRVGIARALVLKPDALFMDEPFSALDVLTAENLRQEVLKLWSDGSGSLRSILIVTHNIEEAVQMADRVVVLGSHPGHVIADVPITLPRPRDKHAAAFESTVDSLYAILTGKADASQGEQQKQALSGLQQMFADSSQGNRTLPDATPGGLAGLLEIVAEYPDGVDLADLASALTFEVDDLFPLLDAGALLGMLDVKEGHVRLTSLGREWNDADILDSKTIFARIAMSHVPLVRSIDRTLRQSKNGKVRGDLIVDLLRGKHTDEVAQQQFRIAVEWGRYGELFDYDSDDDTLSLDEGGQ